MLNAELKVISGKQAGSIIPLAAGRFLIGREEDCHLRPANDLVSRHHCVFKMDEYTVRIRDLGSTNGTFVNGERLRGEVMLNTGDNVRVGTLEFEVTIAEGAAMPEEQVEPQILGGEPDSAQTMEIPVHGQNGETSAYETTAIQSGDTVYQPQPAYDPNYQPYAQMPMGYQMPYPQQQYMYGQPYGMPMGYPQPPMPYQPMYQQPPMPAPVQPTPPPQNAPDLQSRPVQGVSLPDPSQTGAKPPEPPAAGEQKSGSSNAEDVSAKVGDIIKQYTQRRPGGTNTK
jgi:pSer/pThr/pTyr-binding forkhead associated (FHA) protein